MYAIIEAGGKQYKAEQGKFVKVEKIAGEVGEAVEFKTLMIVDGENTVIGTPVVEGASVDATVVKNGKAKKIIVFKYKPKKKYRKKQGHRQPYTKVTIKSINVK